jgi:hypothetical protein
VFSLLYGTTAASLYASAAKLNAQARATYGEAADTYYKAVHLDVVLKSDL